MSISGYDPRGSEAIRCAGLSFVTHAQGSFMSGFNNRAGFVVVTEKGDNHAPD